MLLRLLLAMNTRERLLFRRVLLGSILIEYSLSTRLFSLFNLKKSFNLFCFPIFNAEDDATLYVLLMFVGV